MNLLITGADGQVGSEIHAIASQFPSHQFTFLTKNDLDFQTATVAKISSIIAENHIDCCINCAAYTAVDKAESEPELAEAINHIAVAALAAACKKHNISLLHLSTDYVYHTETKNTALLETDETNPQSVYAKTKLAGDLAVLAVLPTAIVVRTSWVYSSFGHNFVKTMLKLGRERTSLNVVCDQLGTPTYARDLAEALLKIAFQQEKQKNKDTGGIYHYSNEGVTSWYDFAKAVHRLANIITCAVQPIETASYPTPAKRPPFSVLNKTKIKTSFNLDILHWEEALKNCLEVILNQEKKE